MTIITEADIVDSIADALQYISYYHPPDFIEHMADALEREKSPSARDAITQILINSRMAAVGRRPICQDTGSVNVFVRLGVKARIDSEKSLQEMVDSAIRRAYLNDRNPLRASIVHDPLSSRRNTGDNTPGMVSVELVSGDRIVIRSAMPHRVNVRARSAQGAMFLRQLTQVPSQSFWRKCPTRLLAGSQWKSRSRRTVSGHHRPATGRYLVVDHILGLFNDFRPESIKCYAEFSETASAAIATYGQEVWERRFPAAEHVFDDAQRSASGGEAR